MKAVLVLSVLAPLLFGEDAREIVRRAVELDTANTKLARDYSFRQRQRVRELDGAGKVKTERLETWDVTVLDGSPYRRLVARNDQPIPAEEQRSEDARMSRSLQDRRQETSAERERRLSEWTQKQAKQREPVKELPDAFNFTLAGDDVLEGRPVYVIAASPKPGYKPKSALAGFFPKMKLRFWIDQRDYQGARIEMEALDTISLGGILLRVSKGSRLVIEQSRINDEVWLPKKFSLHANARVLLVKGLNRDIEFTFSDYQRLPADARVAAARDRR